MTDTKPEALRLANWLETKILPNDKTTFADVAKKLRQQHEEIKCEEKRFNDLWDKYAALVNKQYPESKFDDPRVQIVYEILCADEAPPKGEHWEGLIARRIVDALAKPEQEPVRWFQQFGDAPPRKEWVGLTDKEIADFSNWLSCMNLVKAIETKLKELNT